LASALAAFAAPEERRYRAVSEEFRTEPWLPIGANPELARGVGDAHSMNRVVKRRRPFRAPGSKPSPNQ